MTTDLLAIAQATGYPVKVSHWPNPAVRKVVAVEPGASDQWRTRGKIPLTPNGVLWHHTAVGGEADAPTLGPVTYGRSDLAGPLCNYLIGRSGTIYLVSGRSANHAGPSSLTDYTRLAHGLPPDGRPEPDTPGWSPNRYLVGIEVENDGYDQRYPDAQLDSLIQLSVMLCRAYGWNENHCWHHRELTRRKTDMSFHGPLRTAVGNRLSTPTPVPIDNIESIMAYLDECAMFADKTGKVIIEHANGMRWHLLNSQQVGDLNKATNPVKASDGKVIPFVPLLQGQPEP